MRAIRTLFRDWAPIVLALLFVALAGRAATPAGYMPAAGADGVHFILCSGQTPPADAPDSPLNHGSSQAGDCPFALVNDTSLAPPAALPLLVPPLLVGAAPPLWRASNAAALEIPTRSQPATGPPNRI